MPNPSFTLMTPTTSDAQKIAQVVQAMVKEAGFDVKIQSTEFATSLNLADKGEFEAYVLAWSGRADPDGNIYSFDACKQPLNYAGYCKPEVDELLNKSRTAARSGRAQEAFEQIAAIVLKDRPIIYLYHRNWLWAYNAKLVGAAHDARRAGARAGTEVQVVERAFVGALTVGRDARVPRPAPRDDRPDAAVRLDADLRAAAAAARRSGDGARRRGARPERRRVSAREAAPRRAAAGALRATGSAACCTATSANRCACRSR